MIYGKNAATFCERRFDPFDPKKECKLLPPLTEEEKLAVRKNRVLVHTFLPELVQWIDELHKEDMIDGWRGVVKVTIFNKGNDHGSA